MPNDAAADQYPPAPWHMRGDMWVTTFRVPADVDNDHPAGTYSVAFVDYCEGSSMIYRELTVNRSITEGVDKGGTTIPDIWVDLPASVRGGREIWAVPKQLCTFRCHEQRRGPIATTTWSASDGSGEFAQAAFRDVSRLAIRLPVPSGTTHQPGLPDGDGPKVGTMSATARYLPCIGQWQFAADGPLGWLQGSRPVFSVRARQFRMTMGVRSTGG